MDEQFREWIRRQPSCHGTGFSEWHDGIGFSIACHVRGSYNAGWAIKPLFSCVPMRQKEHLIEYDLRPLDWYRNQAEHYLNKWLLTLSGTDREFVVTALSKGEPCQK
jgi:hypothetical protein